jgi:hypothetical protein
LRLSENAHLPFDKLTALSKVEGLRYLRPSGLEALRRTSVYASFLGISEALYMDIFRQPLRSRFFRNLISDLQSKVFVVCSFMADDVPVAHIFLSK